MKLSDVKRAVIAIKCAQISRECQNKPEDIGLQIALKIVTKVQEKLDAE